MNGFSILYKTFKSTFILNDLNTKVKHILISLICLVLVKYVYQFNFFVSGGIAVFTFITIELIDGFGKRVPIRELFSFIVFLQLFISPLIAYQYFNNQASFEMYVSQDIYMAYMLPALIAFSLGLHIMLFERKANFSFEKININRKGESVALVLIFVGLVSTFILENVPSGLRFILYLMVMLKFVGAFMLLFSSNKNKWFWILLVYVLFTIETIRGGVFYDLFVWVGFLYILLELKWKSSLLRKLVYFALGFVIIYFVQSIKREYRELTWQKEVLIEDREEVFFEIASEKIGSGNTFKETNNFDRFISRLNTGWIVSKVMEHTPSKEPFVKGELLLKDVKSVFLPRFLFPNKSSTGGEDNRKKFTRFTGRRLLSGTIMRVGAFSDAYINFGVVGGWICMFFVGLFFNILLSYMMNLSSKRVEFLFWVPFVFAYAIRMSDFLMILNYTLKALIFMFMFNYLLNVFVKEKK